MAIDSLAKLKARVGFLANRDDMFATITMNGTAIDSAIATAISNSTFTISRDLAKRGGSGLQESLNDTLVTAAGIETVALPANIAGIKFFSRQTNPVVVLSPKEFSSLIIDSPSNTPGAPLNYATVGITTAYLRPIPDAIYPLRLISFANLADLTNATTNNIFDKHPDVYEACAMVEISLLMEDQDATSRWRVVYEQKMNDMTDLDRMSGWAAAMSGASPTVQVVVA